MAPTICIHCLEAGRVSLSLDGQEFTCAACKQNFGADDVRKLIADLHAAWDERLKWIDTHPARPPATT